MGQEIHRNSAKVTQELQDKGKGGRRNNKNRGDLYSRSGHHAELERKMSQLGIFNRKGSRTDFWKYSCASKFKLKTVS